MNNETKMKYEAPEMNIVIFETADIITTSGGDPFSGDEESLLV